MDTYCIQYYSIDTLQSIKVSMFTALRFKNKTLFTRFINKSHIYQKDDHTFRILWRDRVFGPWLAVVRYRTIFTFNWKPITAHQLMSSHPSKMINQWNMMVLGAGNQLALVAK